MSTDRTGRVVLETGTACRQGCAHAVRLSQRGAAVDPAGPLPASVPDDSATPEDLAETADLLRPNDGRAVCSAVNTRSLDALSTAMDRDVQELGRLDAIVANAGFCRPSPWDQIASEALRDTINTNAVGTGNTVMTGAHHIIADVVAWSASDNSKFRTASQVSISLGVAYC